MKTNRVGVDHSKQMQFLGARTKILSLNRTVSTGQSPLVFVGRVSQSLENLKMQVWTFSYKMQILMCIQLHLLPRLTIYYTTPFPLLFPLLSF